MKKYIRTKDGIYKNKQYQLKHIIEKNGECFVTIEEKQIIKTADTIEELCDEFVLLITPDDGEKYGLCMFYTELKNLHKYPENGYYGAIWTDKGLIFVAKMNKEGELELL